MIQNETESEPEPEVATEPEPESESEPEPVTSTSRKFSDVEIALLSSYYFESRYFESISKVEDAPSAEEAERRSGKRRSRAVSLSYN